MHREIFEKLLKSHTSLYIVVETKYTLHHIERLMPTCRDRGRFKWIAEMKVEVWENVGKDEEAKRCHIDGGDLFPRLYFLDDSLCNELFAWLQMRNLEIIDIRTPKI